MKNIKANKSVLIKYRDKSVIAYDMTHDELYLLKGDVGVMLEILERKSKEGASITRDSLKQELIQASESFKNSEFQNQSMDESLTYLKELSIINYDT